MTLFFLLLLFANTACADVMTQSHVADLLPGNARWGLVAVELKTGKELVRAGNAVADPLEPASLIKLFTSGAVLDQRERHRELDLRTMLLHDGEIMDGTLHGNLYLVGRGNAFLSVKDLRSVAQAVARKGIHRVTGCIIADDTFFDTSGVERRRNGPGYAGAGALGLDLHTTAVTLIPTEPGKPPRALVEPLNDAVRLAVSALTTDTAATTLRVVRIDDTSYRVTGNIPVNSTPLKWRFPLAEPALFAGSVFKNLLEHEGVKIRGEVKKGKSPAKAESLIEIPGSQLSRMLGEMNRHSLNVVADNLLLVLGARRYGGPGTKENGLKAVTEFLASLDLPMDEVKPADGSGLSGDNRTTASFMARYLARAKERPWFSELYDSLPRAGMDGTAARIGYRNERFRIKTGMLEDVFALAGYGVDGKGREVAFAYIVNVPGGGVMGLERSGAEVMKLLSAME